ncbi:MAG: hypothetical protein QNK04_25555 [Myxococcota bacterium]|nr:hypothetical protein [Myxococcota bacterium]
MATHIDSVAAATLSGPRARNGPVTQARLRRTGLLYAGMCLLGSLPVLAGASAGWQAAGLGLWMPGAGFIGIGGAAALLFPLTLALFGLSLVAWFWAGAVVAPVLVWLGSAALAGAVAGSAIWPGAPMLVPILVLATVLFFRFRATRRSAAHRERYAARTRFLPQALEAVEQRATAAPAPGGRELAPEDLAALRYALDRALQPLDAWNGFDVLDQFQPAALRYQLNHLGYALALARCHYAPSFAGYLDHAQRNLIDKYLQKRVWDYWVYESCWGHLNFRHFDPVVRDNIMLTGWFGLQVGQYMISSGDRRYAEPGSLSFRLSSRTVYAHDFGSVIQSIVDGWERSDFCLFPCEPNWIYPICNHYGMAAVATHDRIFGSRFVPERLPRFLEMLGNEFTDESGSLIGLRSQHTGLAVPFPASEVGYTWFANCFAPGRARNLWAIARHELEPCLVEDAEGRRRLSLPGSPIDPGNYRGGPAFAYATVLTAAREFGDEDVAEAALRSLEADCELASDGGVQRYARASNLSNAQALQGRLMRQGDFRGISVEGPPDSAHSGPILAEARYPDVLVAKAFGSDDGLDLVLYPGAAPGRQAIRLEQLRPGGRYGLEGAEARPFRADPTGSAALEVELRGRTALRLVERD